MVDTDTLFPHSSAGAEFKRRYHGVDGTRCPVCQTSDGVSAVSPEFFGCAPPADMSIQTQFAPTQMSAATAPFNSSPFPLPPTLRGSPISSHASDNSAPHFGYNASSGIHHPISGHHSLTVVMPTPTGIRQYGGSIGAHTTGHYDPSFEFTHDNYMIEYLRVTQPTIGAPIVPAYLGLGASSAVDPVLSSDPTLRWSPGYLINTYQHGPSPDSTLSPVDSTSYLSPYSPLPSNNHSFVFQPSEMSNQIQPQPITTASVEQPYTLTVPLENIEFPSISGTGEVPFFQCFWENCGIWITSDKEAVKDHLTRIHGVVFNGQTADSACCGWVGCSSSSKKSTLVRHFRSHLGLKWLCSACKGEYARPDSVKWHVRQKPQCQSAQAISYPSAAAYRAIGINGNTVTLTKILQP